MARNRPSTSSSAPPRFFVDDEAQERYGNLRKRLVFFEQGFVFKEEDLGPDVMEVVAQHKWERFARHPGDVNATLVKEFYANITEPNQHSVFVRGKYIRFTPSAINRYFKLPTMVDNHTTFKEEADNETYHDIVEDLCLPNSEWNGKQVHRRSMDREKFLPKAKLWTHFLKHKLMPTSHHTTVSLPRMLLLHSILFGHSMDVGKIIVEEIQACLKRPKSALLFPNLITALCRKKKVKEDRFDEIVSGISGITLEKLPSLMGFKEGKAKESAEEHHQSGAIQNALAKLETFEESVNQTKDQLEALTGNLKTFFAYVKKRDEVMLKVYEEMIPHMPVDLPTFPEELLPTAENATASPEVDHQQDQEGPLDEDPLNTKEQDPRPQPQDPAAPIVPEPDPRPQPQDLVEPIASEQSHNAPHANVVEVPSQSDLPEQISPHKGGRRKKTRAGRILMSSPTKATEGPSDTPDAHESDPAASPSPLRKRPRRTATSPTLPPA
ncbi:hypothetical protein V6N11_050621 [Hibiscus sabdariffa]|uniref:Putative plant transposon protein domain-containing protein n=1 Tax=Hibiscus sabdariffa TaxID=183260 RepID=A0ABR2TAR2_9ROSI